MKATGTSKTPLIAVLGLALLTQVTLGAGSLAAGTTKPAGKPAAPPASTSPAVQGTQQLAGGSAVVGKTYTLFLGTTDAINYTIRKAEYSVGHFYKGDEDDIRPEGEKALILHLTIQNPQKVELGISGNSIRFTGVDSKNQSVAGDGAWFAEATHSEVHLQLKPGQKIDVYTRIVLAGDVSLPRLIVDDANSKVWRYDLKGQVAPLAAPFANPSVKDGSAALDEVPGKAGVFYPAVLDVRVDKVDVPASQPDGMDVGSNQKVVVVYLTFHNANLVPQSMVPGAAYSFRASLLDQDGISVDYQHLYLGSRDKELGGDLPAGKDAGVRVLFAVDKDVVPTTVKLRLGGGLRFYAVALPPIAK
ncbi:hypothetical protein EHF33_09795 [Deinococcus psychrotolerans]|uniref:DUF4352 domain-containing protein n=1 Tax=Deinococcus psychrotolerans TaxID=2489213 RepID=A0A3G8YPA5_9DEIO|nr:hypothetical protein [Deinococcus psychrotolerans]AZI42996.1 hypothetical protein EHF33_09795 [Deinococcus psychrotolerans]